MPRTALRPTCTPFYLTAALLWLTAGCSGTASDTSPAGAIAAYAQALEAGDADAAYRLMSKEYRRSLDEDAFREHMQSYDAESREAAKTLSSRALSVNEEARVTLLNGTELSLVREKGRWRIASPVAFYYDQGTPRAALRSFVSAMEHGRWDVMLDLMPEEARGDLTADALGERLSAQREEIERMLALLKTSLDLPIERTGARATMPYGERFAVRFVLEGKLWKIEDPE